MYQQFLKSIEQFGSFSETDQELLTGFLIERRITKGEFIIKQGDTSRSVCFVNKKSAFIQRLRELQE